LTVTSINPTGFAGKVADPAVAVAALEKFNKLSKNSCQARVGRPVSSINGLVGSRWFCGVDISFLQPLPLGLQKL
jgi:hypothetical protein